MPNLSLEVLRLPKEAKQKLAKELTDVLYAHMSKEYPHVRKEDITVFFHELAPENVAKGGALAADLIAKTN